MEINLMRKILFQIIETVLFFLVIFLIAQVMKYYGINFKFLYVFGGLLIVWVIIKMILIRFINHKKSVHKKRI